MCKSKIFLALSVGPKGMVKPMQGEPRRGAWGAGRERCGDSGRKGRDLGLNPQVRRKS